MSERSLLAIDVGNTQVVTGLFRNGKCVQTRRFETEFAKKTSTLKKNLKNTEVLEGVVFSNVVPSVRKKFLAVCREVFKVSPLEVHVKTAKMPLRVDFPKEVGADRLCNAVAAWEKYRCATIVVDFGTATTLDIVTAKGEYGGGAIAPGIGSQAKALSQFCAQLFEVKVTKPKRVIGRNTEECIQAGLYYGSIGLVDALIERSIKEEGVPMKILATGGFASLVAKESKWIEKIEPSLTLEGLYYIWQRNK